MPPFTTDYLGYTEALNAFLKAIGSRHAELQFEYGTAVEDSCEPELADKQIIGNDLRYLFASIPRLGSNGKLIPRDIKMLIHARSKTDFMGYQSAFRSRVAWYLSELRDAEENQREALREQFHNEAKNDLAKLRRELGRHLAESVIAKEGIVTAAAGAMLGAALGETLNAVAGVAIGGILGTVRGFLGYQNGREEILSKHWTSWAFATTTGRFSVV